VLHVRGLAEDAHVRQNAVIDEVMRAHAVAAKFLADEFIAPLRLLNFADDGGDGDVSFELYAGAHQSLHRLRVADQRAFHVVDAQAVNHLVANDGFGFVAEPSEKSFAAGVGGVHVAVEHQALAVVGAFPKTDDVCARVFYFLPRNIEAQIFEGFAHVAPHLQLFTGGAGDVHDVAAHGDNFVLANLREDGLGQVIFHRTASFRCVWRHGLCT